MVRQFHLCRASCPNEFNQFTRHGGRSSPTIFTVATAPEKAGSAEHLLGDDDGRRDGVLLEQKIQSRPHAECRVPQLGLQPGDS